MVGRGVLQHTAVIVPPSHPPSLADLLFTCDWSTAVTPDRTQHASSLDV